MLAFDEDAGQTLEWRILGTSNDTNATAAGTGAGTGAAGGPFSLSASTGQLRTLAVLDYESASSYTFYVAVKDSYALRLHTFPRRHLLKSCVFQFLVAS